MTDDEIERMKAIDLVAFAAGELGFEMVRAKTSRNSVCMDGPEGSRIIVSRAEDGHMVFFAVHDNRVAGSILDLAMHTKQISLGRARQLVRPWIGHDATMGVPYSAGAPAPPLPSGQHPWPIAQVERSLFFAGMSSRHGTVVPGRP